MSSRDYVKTQIDALPDSIIARLEEFITFQMFSLGLLDSDTDYLNAVPGMAESIKAGLSTPLTDCIPLSEVWPDV